MTVELFDTHFHLSREDSVGDLTAAAAAAGVTRLIAVAGNLEDSERLPGIVAARDGMYCTAGVHPHEAEEFAGDLTPFRRLLRLPPAVAVGEIGLDYYYRHAAPAAQREVFAAFLSLSSELRLPAVIHCRDAYDDCLAMLNEHTTRPYHAFEIHSYTGTPEWAETIAALGGYFSVNGIISFQKANNVRAALSAIPLERLLLETDSPYLAPVPHRGKRNQPAYLIDVAKKVAECKHLSLEEVAAVTTRNAKHFFQVP
ncbi:MAG: TatD family hydrolase [Lentisphaeria bacterium]|nr:TatD family hydrolase [Lentisphaeria bacterium]